MLNKKVATKWDPVTGKTLETKTVPMTPEEQRAAEQGGQDFISQINNETNAGLNNTTLARSAAQQDIATAEALAAAHTPEAIAQANMIQLQANKTLQDQAIAQETQRLQGIQNEADAQKQIDMVKQLNANPKSQGQYLGNNGMNINENGRIVHLEGGGANQYNVGDITGMPPQRINAIESGFDEITQTAAQIFNAQASIIREGRPYDVKKATDQFNFANKVTIKDIADVRNGQTDYVEALGRFQAMEDAVKILEETNKGLGKANTYYQSDQGLTTATKVNQEKELIIQLRKDLEVARQQAQVNQARTNLGMSQTNSQNTDVLNSQSSQDYNPQ